MAKISTFLLLFCFILSGCNSDDMPPSNGSISTEGNSGNSVVQQYEITPLLDQEDFSTLYPFILHESDSNVYIFSISPASLTSVNTDTWEAESHRLEFCDYAVSYDINPQLGILLVVSNDAHLNAYSLDGDCLWSQQFNFASVRHYGNQWVLLSEDGSISTVDQFGNIAECTSITPLPDRIYTVTGVNESGISLTSVSSILDETNPTADLREVYDWTGKLISSTTLSPWEQICGIYYDEVRSSALFVGHLKGNSQMGPRQIDVVSVPFSGEYKYISNFVLPDFIDDATYELKYAYMDEHNTYIFGHDSSIGFMLLLNDDFELQESCKWPIAENETGLWAKATDSGISMLVGNTSPKPYKKGEVSGLNHILVAPMQ